MIVKKLHNKMNMGVYTCMPEVSKRSKETSQTPTPLAHVPTHHLHQVADSLALLNPPTSSTTSRFLPHCPNLLIQHHPLRWLALHQHSFSVFFPSFSFFLLSSLSLVLSIHSFIPHWAGSIKSSRRSSYVLAISSERSKSCDEGLNTFREDGRSL